MKTAPSETSPTHPHAGRPSIYSRDLAQRICDLLAHSCKSLRAICQLPDMPGRATIYVWLHEIPEFQDMYTIAREEQLEFLADEMLQIAEDASNDFLETKDGPVPNRQAIARTKIRIATRQWLITHLMPKKYQAQHEDDQSEPEPRRHLTLAEFEERLKLAKVNAQ